MKTRILGVMLVVLVSAVSEASIYVPPGLLPGDKYHLAFVTQGATFVTSSNIGVYNSFVAAEAGRSGSITETFGIDWFAIGSTATVSANTNALVSAPVYLLDGVKLADGFTDMWDGSIDSAFDMDQFGADVGDRELFTGTQTTGASHPTQHFGTVLSPNIVSGDTSGGTSAWINWGLRPLVERNPLYALSEELTVPNSVPEAASLLTWIVLCGLFVSYRQRDCRQRKPL